MSRLLDSSAGTELLIQLDDVLEHVAPGGPTHAELSTAYAEVEQAIELADLQRARSITHHAIERCGVHA